jgi:hypothetical protein
MQRSLEPVKIMPRNLDVDRIVFKISPLQGKTKRDDTRHAASAHPPAEHPQVLPHAVSNHLFALLSAPPPQQQPVIQQEECRAEHGTKCANENLTNA